MLSWEQSVYSSNVTSVGYDADAKLLYITWNNGRQSVYEGVDEEKALRVANAASVGQAVNNEIKPGHAHKYVR